MKYYTASEIVKRARNLADLGNTDFISYEEESQYLNDSWVELYNNIISIGDKQFVEEVLLSGESSAVGEYTEYDLPPNLYKICSVKDRYSGTIINRASESDCIGSGTYDIVNNKLRLYGKSSDVMLTYWLTPRTITHPNKAVPIQLDSNIISFAKNSVLTEDGEIINLLTGATVGQIEIDEKEYYLGNGHILTVDENNNIEYLSFTGTVLGTVSVGSVLLGRDHDWNLYYSDSDKWYILGNETSKDVRDITEWFPAVTFDGEDAWYHLEDGKLLDVEFEYNGTTVTEDVEWKGISLVAVLEYGPLTTDGTNLTLYSGVPDTDMNFPKELFFSLMAANLAVRFLMKQNADSSGMNSIYENMLSTYRNSLSENGNYRVITNAY